MVRFLGIRDGLTASMASQGTLSDETPPGSSADVNTQQLLPPTMSQRRSRSFEIQAKILERSMTVEAEAAAAKTRDKKENGKYKK